MRSPRFGERLKKIPNGTTAWMNFPHAPHHPPKHHRFLGVKAVFVVLTIFGHANLWTAIAAEMGVSLAVAFNAVRLLRAGAETMIAREVVLAGRDGL